MNPPMIYLLLNCPCTASNLSVFSHCPTSESEEAGGALDSGRGQPGQLTLAHQKDIPYLRVSCSVIKSWGKKLKPRMFVVIWFIFLGNLYVNVLKLHFLECDWTCICQHEVLNKFLIFPHSSVKLCSSCPSLDHILLGENEKVCGFLSAG